jgi:hypothetical protein
MPMKAHSKPVLPMLFGIVLTVVLLLAGSVAFGGGKPAPTYSWNVYLPVNSSSLQGTQGSPSDFNIPDVGSLYAFEVKTPENLVWTINKTYSVFRFEVVKDSEVKISLGSSVSNCDPDDCGNIEEVWLNAQPDEGYGQRLFVTFASPNGYLYDQQTIGESFTCTGGVFRITIDSAPDIDPLVSGKNYVYGSNYPTFTVTRLGDNTWRPTGSTDNMNLEERQTLDTLVCNPKNNRCQTQAITQDVAKAVGSGITFDLYFVRTQTN